MITAADQANGSVTNVATVTGTPPGGPPTTTPSPPVVVDVPAPGINILKQQRIDTTGDFTSNTLTANPGDTVNYKMIVSNTGGTSLSLSLDDPHCVLQLVKRHFGYIRHVHVNEMDGRHPGTGSFDFRPVFQTLAGLKYSRWVSLEVFDFKPGAVQIIREAMQFFENLEKKL